MKVKLGLLLMIIGACSQAKAEPTLYVCYPADIAGAQPSNYIVVEPETGDFILFDGVGMFVNQSTWKPNSAFADSRTHLVTNINGISVFMNLESDPNTEGAKVWSMVMYKEGYDPAKSYCF